jgi:hypothetical protein
MTLYNGGGSGVRARRAVVEDGRSRSCEGTSLPWDPRATFAGQAMLHVATPGLYGCRAGLAGASTRGLAARGSWLALRGHIGALLPRRALVLAGVASNSCENA